MSRPPWNPMPSDRLSVASCSCHFPPLDASRCSNLCSGTRANLTSRRAPSSLKARRWSSASNTLSTSALDEPCPPLIASALTQWEPPERHLVDTLSLVVVGPAIERRSIVHDVKSQSRPVPFGRLGKRVLGQVVQQPGVAGHSLEPPAQRLGPLLVLLERPADENVPEAALFEVARHVADQLAAQAVHRHAAVAI